MHNDSLFRAVFARIDNVRGWLQELLQHQHICGQIDWTSFDKNGGNMGVPGSVTFSFLHKGVVLVQAGATTEEKLFDVVLGAGAEDVVGGEEGWQVTCAPADLGKVRDALESAGIPFEGAEVSYIPTSTTEVDDATRARVAKLVALLE